MAARFATAGYTYQNAAGTQVTIEAGETRDTVTDAAEIAVFAANWTAAAPSPAAVSPAVFGWLAVYPRGQVS